MNIGTGKDLDEYNLKGTIIPYHLIDIKDPGYKYNIGEFQLDFQEACKKIIQNNAQPILCGGSGLYIESALRGNTYLGIESDKNFAKQLDDLSLEELDTIWQEKNARLNLNLAADTRIRKIRAIEIAEFLLRNPDWKPREKFELNEIIIGTDLSRELRREKITKRLSQRLNNGLIEEVEWLLKNYLTFDDLEYYGLEYKWVGNYLQAKINKKELFEGLNIAIHQFAKRQMTWFRKMENEGFKINWVNVEKPIEEQVEEVLNYFEMNKKRKDSL